MISLRLFSFFISVTLLSSMLAMEEEARPRKRSLDLVEQSQQKRRKTIGYDDLADETSTRVPSLKLLCAQELRKHITCQELIKAMNEQKIPGSDVVIKALVEAHPIFDLLSQYTPYKKELLLKDVKVKDVITGVRKEVKLSPNLKFCGVGTKIWDVEKGTVKKEFNKDSSLGAWSSDSKCIGVATPDGRTVEIWDIEADVKKGSFTNFKSAYWGAGRRQLFIQYNNSSVLEVWDVYSNKMTKKFENCKNYIVDSNYLYLGITERSDEDESCIYKFWDIARGEKIMTIPFVAKRYFWTPNSRYLCRVFDKDGHAAGIKMWDIEQGGIKKELNDLGSMKLSFPCVSPNSRYVIIFCSDNKIRISDLEKNEVKKEIETRSVSCCRNARWSPDSRYVALLWRDQEPSEFSNIYQSCGRLEIWDIERGSIKKEFRLVNNMLKKGSKSCCLWSHDSRHIAVKFTDNTVKIIDIESDNVVCWQFDNVEGFCASPDFERFGFLFYDSDCVAVDIFSRSESGVNQLRDTITRAEQVDALEEIRPILAGMGSEGQKRQLLLDLKKGDTEKDRIVDRVLAMMP